MIYYQTDVSIALRSNGQVMGRHSARYLLATIVINVHTYLFYFITDNNENANTLYQALNNAGYVDKFISAVFSIGVTMYGGQGLGMLRLLAASQIIDECLDLPTGNDYGGGPGNMIPPPLRDIDRSVYI